MLIRIYGTEFVRDILFEPTRKGTTFVHEFLYYGMYNLVIDVMIDEFGFNDEQWFENLRPEGVPDHLKLSPLLMRVPCRSLLDIVIK